MVWCQRSDGLNVTHACGEISALVSKSTCHPPCTVNNSICTTQSECACRQGFIPRWRQNETELERCILEVNLLGNNIDIILPKMIPDPSHGAGEPTLPTFVWIVIGVCTFYVLLFIIGIAVIMRRRRQVVKEKRKVKEKDDYRQKQVQQNSEEIVQLERLLSDKSKSDLEACDDKEGIKDDQMKLSQTDFNTTTLPKRLKRSMSTRNSSVSSGRGSILFNDEVNEDDWPEPPVEMLDAKTWHARQRGLFYTGMVYKPKKGRHVERESSAYDEVDLNDALLKDKFTTR